MVSLAWHCTFKRILSPLFTLSSSPPCYPRHSSSRARRKSSNSLLPKAYPRALPRHPPWTWCDISGNITRSTCSGGCRRWSRAMTQRLGRRRRGREGGREWKDQDQDEANKDALNPFLMLIQSCLQLHNPYCPPFFFLIDKCPQLVPLLSSRLTPRLDKASPPLTFT